MWATTGSGCGELTAVAIESRRVARDLRQAFDDKASQCAVCIAVCLPLNVDGRRSWQIYLLGGLQQDADCGDRTRPPVWCRRLQGRGVVLRRSCVASTSPSRTLHSESLATVCRLTGLSALPLLVTLPLRALIEWHARSAAIANCPHPGV